MVCFLSIIMYLTADHCFANCGNAEYLPVKFSPQAAVGYWNTEKDAITHC